MNRRSVLKSILASAVGLVVPRWAWAGSRTEPLRTWFTVEFDRYRVLRVELYNKGKVRVFCNGEEWILQGVETFNGQPVPFPSMIFASPDDTGRFGFRIGPNDTFNILWLIF